MKEIIKPVAKELLIKELTKDKFIRDTNMGGNELYIFSSHDSPALMQEVGRLRELTFRMAGGGTGKEIDIDSYDTAEKPYSQLIVWDKDEKEILGGYRFLYCDNTPKDGDGKIKLATNGLFEFSENFIENYLPYTIELGRSFVQLSNNGGQASRKTLFALDNLWDGLGAIMTSRPEMKYFFGKVTMYQNFDAEARDMILYFLNKHFYDKDKLLLPISPLTYKTDISKLEAIFSNTDYKEDYKTLSKEVRNRNEVIPPLINSYMNLSPTMLCFGTTLNSHFGNVEETGIMIKIEDIYEKKKKRHLEF